MTQDEIIIAMAREAGFEVNYYKSLESEEVVSFDPIITYNLERFAALVAAHEREKCFDAAMKAAEKAVDTAMLLEREACAKVCEENGKEPDDHKTYEGYDEGYQDGSNNCAAAIRARNNKE